MATLRQCTVFTLMLSGLLLSLPAAGGLPVYPLDRNGTCPIGYLPSGNYCSPTDRARYALPKSGACPIGYLPSGNYCVATDRADYAMPRNGSCPLGYLPSGNYCIETAR